MTKQIFRQAALARLSSPEQLDSLLEVTSPRGCLALIALLCIGAAALLWSIFGTISTTVDGSGLLLRPGGVLSVVAPRAGVITNVLAFPGQDIHRGNTVVRIAVSDANEDQKVEEVLPS